VTFRRVTTQKKALNPNYFKTVFVRDNRVKNYHVSLCRWFWLCFLEILFGEELLEHLVITSTWNGTNDTGDNSFGQPLYMNLLVPSGLLTNWFRLQLYQLVFYKFSQQYLLIQIFPADGEPTVVDSTNELDISNLHFQFRKELLHQIIPFRRVYLCTALAVNFSADLAAYFLTSSVTFAIVVGVLIESVRRLFKL
jgi:hypothetical protein